VICNVFLPLVVASEAAAGDRDDLCTSVGWFMAMEDEEAVGRVPSSESCFTEAT
jgi:hypothetical protein